MIETANISTIEHGSDAYHYAVELREKVLRRPLGLSFSTSELLDEKDSIHIVCKQGDQIIGTCLLKPVSEGAFRMRQLAVKSEYQRKGLGTSLVVEAERIAREQGFKEIQIHARESVISFYSRLGYLEEGDFFMEVSLPHKLMRKRLVPSH